ncbi:MAG TPA: glycine cleavage system aminomethyltransferase GcvT [Mycobacteriales bacterium]|nr:glycine cleavage system aminomethyltransferase GcvT [Mycobacteriales bacterium]
MTDDLLHSPVHHRHVELGARMAEFGGWEMPIQYRGVVEEHTAVRESVGLFDVSHLGNVEVVGPGASQFVNGCFTNDLDRIGTGQAQYTLCCDDATGGVVDDLIVYQGQIGAEHGDDLHLVPNAANAQEVVRRLRAAAPAGVDVLDQHRDFAILAVQGPKSAAVLDTVGLGVDLDYMAFTQRTWADGRVVICRTGYTGEHGYELVAPAGSAAALWDELLAAVTSYGGQPCGLGARDTLRTEMGYPLHGQDLSLGITPVQARCGWAVGWSKPAFWGRDVLVAERESGPARLLWGLRAEDRGIPRPHMTVRDGDGTEVGEVTSGTFSPSLRIGIGLALLDRTISDGDAVTVDVRGRPSTMRVVKPPFVPTHVK